MPPPFGRPIGLELSRSARIVALAFDEALAQAGGSRPIWLIMTSLKSRPGASQRELAELVGIQDATLTHHLNAMESTGLVTRRRDPENRRVHVVELTATGETLFRRLRDAAGAFDARLREDMSEADVATLRGYLERLVRNVGPVDARDISD
jgi:MarR family transcriptional regulator, transcriptional regulator for hemolysin